MEVREEIIETCLKLAEKGLVIGTGGNVSVRTDGGFFITPSGVDYALLAPEDIIELDLEGAVISGARVPSIEKGLHRRILLARRDINALIHTHSTCAVAVASCRKPLPPLTDNQVAYFGGTVLVAEHAPIGTEELAKNAVEALGPGGAVLLANHGALCAGGSLKEALFKCELLEELARIYIYASMAGGGVALTDEETALERDILARRYGRL